MLERMSAVANAMETRTENILAVIKEIYRMPGISKPELCSACGLAASTVQGIIARLTEQGAVRAMGEAGSTGGRRAMRYRINNEHRGIVAIHIGTASVRIGILNLGLEVQAQKERPAVLAQTGPESYTAEVAADVQKMLEASHFGLTQVIGVGISLPGPADHHTGSTRQLPGAPAWNDFPLGARMRDALGLPVWVDKDLYLSARYLVYCGQITGEGTGVYLSVRETVRAAVIMDGLVFRGAHGFAGEVGHTTVRRDGIRCSCGSSGCLELYCSDTGILNQYNILGDEPCPHIDELAHRAERGDEVANQVLAQAVRYLTEAVANLVMNYDPAEIIVGCRWLEKQKKYYFSLLDGLYAKSDFTRKYTVAVKLLQDTDDLLPAAAAPVGERYLFSSDSSLVRVVDE